MNKKQEIENFLVWHYDNYERFDLDPAPNSESVNKYITLTENQVFNWAWKQNLA